RAPLTPDLDANEVDLHLEVNGASAGSRWSRAGLQRGDRIVGWEGGATEGWDTTVNGFLAEVAASKEPITLHVERDGKPLRLLVRQKDEPVVGDEDKLELEDHGDGVVHVTGVKRDSRWSAALAPGDELPDMTLAKFREKVVKYRSAARKGGAVDAQAMLLVRR